MGTAQQVEETSPFGSGVPRVDLDAYFRRIGYGGPRTPTLATLRFIQQRHAAAIAFENLNPLLHWPLPLDLDSLQRKLLYEGRGGYCYEHNRLLSAVLRALGFRVTDLAARVIWNSSEDSPGARTHMLLSVEVEDATYVVDVGFGGQTPTGPLLLQPDIEQVTPHEPYRLVRRGTDWSLCSFIHGEWKGLYRFDLQPQFLADYEMASWYLSNHPHSHFVTSLVAARASADRRYALRNNTLAIHSRDGSTERHVLTSGAEIREVLEINLCLTLPDAPQLDAALERIAAGA